DISASKGASAGNSFRTPSPSSPSIAGRANGIDQGSNPLDGDLHAVSRRQGPDSRGRAGGDEISREEGHDSRDESNEKGGREDHLARGRVLPEDPVDASFDREIAGIHIGLNPGSHGRERIESLGPGELNVPLLQLTRRDVVET